MKLQLTEKQGMALVELRSLFGDRQCVLIGATALGFRVPMSRSTKDVDLAVAAPIEDLPGTP